ncbi:unnamed protein product [Closterium sp. NIES-54]
MWFVFLHSSLSLFLLSSTPAADFADRVTVDLDDRVPDDPIVRACGPRRVTMPISLTGSPLISLPESERGTAEQGGG